MKTFISSLLILSSLFLFSGATSAKMLATPSYICFSETAILEHVPGLSGSDAKAYSDKMLGEAVKLSSISKGFKGCVISDFGPLNVTVGEVVHKFVDSVHGYSVTIYKSAESNDDGVHLYFFGVEPITGDEV